MRSSCPPALLSGLAGDAEPGTDLGPGVTEGAQALDGLGYGGVDLIGEIGHKAECFHVAVADTAGLGAQDAADECAVLVVLDQAPSTATRALATFRSILAFAVADAWVQHNVAAAANKPTSGRARREGQALTSEELRALVGACQGHYRDVVPVLALAGLRWGELG